ncbi:hypothetical protein AVEN_12514-1 [Araneus ventricosus]|uniref:Uncharacterized protein n=1 Tax=Araneus ventricosus TaxID=182803 RepID=A0A4Y2JG86_ARAVE|nr:hypothetical protein AVEN_12514-1 [Araneus ventricosus]
MSMQRILLEEINNISKLCSEIDDEENSGGEDGIYDLLDNDSELFDTDNEEENIVNTGKGRKIMRLFSSPKTNVKRTIRILKLHLMELFGKKFHKVLDLEDPRFILFSEKYQGQRNMRNAIS